LAATETAAMGSATAQPGWSSRTAFVLAAIGAAVGLGNVWRFPTLAGESGGGAFVIFYVACVVLIGLPLILSEVMIGRAGNTDAVGSIRKISELSGSNPRWKYFGVIGVVAAFLILSFYSVVAGWVVYYIGVMGADLVANLGNGDLFGGALQAETTAQVQGRMGALFENVELLITMHLIFMGITLWVVSRGVTEGIEKAATYLMPTFFVLLIGITIYGGIVGDMGEALRFMFSPDFSKLTPQVMNTALGQAFFSLSLGVAGLITYGSYVSRDTPLGTTSGMIAFADTAVALIAGLMIFPIVFAVGLDPAAGPTLVFQSLPIAFQQMPAGSVVGFLFFVLIFFAALTSSISLLEVPTAWGIGEMGWSRRTSSLVFGGGAFVVGIACLLSLNVWSDFKPLAFWPIFEDLAIMDALDGFTGKVMLPLGALLTSIFVGWIADRKLVRAESGLGSSMFGVWRFLIAWLCPIAVTLILVFGLFPGLIG